MLIRFGVENYRSINTYQELTLTASSLKDPAATTLKIPGLKQQLLPAIVVYGANAAGKSNLLRAFSFMRGGILRSQTMKSATGGIGHHPFRLHPNSHSKPSRFDCDVLVNNVRYHYGFKVDEKIVHEEWLYAFPFGQRQVLYHRKHNDLEEFYFGKHLRGKNKTIKSLTRNNSLFLSVAAENNHAQLTELYKYFSENYVVLHNTDNASVGSFSKYFENPAMKKKIVGFLREADTGIVGAKVETKERPENIKEMLSDIRSVLSKHVDFKLSSSDPDDAEKSVRLAHQGTTKKEVYFDPDEESSGTLSLLKILGPIFDVLSNGKTILIDELYSNMHPLLSCKLLNLFNSKATNTGKGQLLFTTHDTNLLSTKVMRRDQIWFAEKNLEGETYIYPLTDIRTRNTDNLEKGYLEGRFGAIPFLGDCKYVFGSDENAQ